MAIATGDPVLRIDSTDLVGPSAEGVCRYQLNKVEPYKDPIHMRVVRGSATMQVDLERQVFTECRSWELRTIAPRSTGVPT